jgi:hypothetical protein
MDRKGIDVQVIFPTPHYAQMTVDPGFEAALFRSYNRYIACQCKRSPERLNGPACFRCETHAKDAKP